jgi:hypothetical protein
MAGAMADIKTAAKKRRRKNGWVCMEPIMDQTKLTVC